MAINSDLFETAKRIVLTLRNAGFEAFLVGGSVRDLLLGGKPLEYDIVTSALPRQVQSLFSRTFPVGESFGVILVSENGNVFEVATYRTEKGYIDGRRPSQVNLSGSAEEDVRRRDFTINGLLMDPETGCIIDFVEGRKDIEKRIVRTIGSPDERFSEDHLRMLRAVRFTSTLCFTLDDQSLKAVKQNAHLIRRISAERIRNELTRILTMGDSRRGLELLSESGLLSHILPEIESMRSVSQPEKFHPEGDVWEHTLRMIGFLSERQDSLRSDVRFVWGVLLHDVGKPETRSVDESGIHFYGHSRKGEIMAEKIMQRLRFSRSEIDTVVSMVGNHMKFMNVMGMRPNRLIRFIRIPDFSLHLELHKLDCLASHGNLDNYYFCRSKLNELPEEVLRPERLITGSDLKKLGFKPGPLFGEILRCVEDAQLDGELKSKEEALSFVLGRWGKEIK